MLGKIKKSMEGCTDCKLHKNRTNVVPGVGHSGSKVMFIGEGPGRNEDIKGKPFVGAAGNNFDRKYLKILGLNRDEVFITNTVRCRPPNNRDPEDDELESCFKYLKAELEEVKPDIIVLMGNTPLKNFTGKSGGITAISRSGETIEEHNIECIDDFNLYAVLHPAFLQYGPGDDRIKAASNMLMSIREELISNNVIKDTQIKPMKILKS